MRRFKSCVTLLFMATSSGIPLALKVFFFSLLTGAGGGYAAFKIAVYLTLKYWRGDNPDSISFLMGLAAALVFGTCSAITGGVLAGRATKT